jgi:hypothetical protein
VQPGLHSDPPQTTHLSYNITGRTKREEVTQGMLHLRRKDYRRWTWKSADKRQTLRGDCFPTVAFLSSVELNLWRSCSIRSRRFPFSSPLPIYYYMPCAKVWKTSKGQVALLNQEPPIAKPFALERIPYPPELADACRKLPSWLCSISRECQRSGFVL